jgi:hypothetical protein
MILTDKRQWVLPNERWTSPDHAECDGDYWNNTNAPQQNVLQGIELRAGSPGWI